MSQIEQHEWQTGLCSFFSSGHCFMGCCCPCMLANRTHELLEDPDEKTPSGCGPVGCGWCLAEMAGGLGCIFGFLQRKKIREKHGIEGSTCGDLCVNWCCPCCSVIQQLNELEMRRDARQVNKAGYQQQAPMRQ
ncbi:PLAC8 family-domain-containing protein [Chaetomium fimeti]|uniref:PLAC8 family-domain-containing protein n=1 Tax=Chaetomium fimeti TaxID=1854472 RepID=A0AAE0H5S1_9PEZI|nr:PLAC8 family-domain-containing protein [Chaetomium fimeti]